LGRAVLAGSGDNTPDTVQDKFPIIRDTDDARAFDGLFYQSVKRP